MSKMTVTNFSKRIGSPLQAKEKSPSEIRILHEEIKQKTNNNKRKVTNFSKRTGILMQAKEKSPTEIRIVHAEDKHKTFNDKQNITNYSIKTSTPLQTNEKPPSEIRIVHEEDTQKTNSDEQNITNFNIKTEIPFQANEKSPSEIWIVHEEVIQKTNIDKQKEKQNELLQKVNRKTAEYQAGKPASGVFTEVVTHGAFTKTSKSVKESTPPRGNGSNGSKPLLGFPSSANDLALDAKTDLESEPNISMEVKEKVIEKLFALVSMVQHVYESKVRIMTEFEKFKDTHMKNEIRREKEHSEQMYKVNMNFQNEVVQAIQRLKSELDLSRIVAKNVNEESDLTSRDTSVDFNTSDDSQDVECFEKGDNVVEQPQVSEITNDIEKISSDAIENE